MTIFKKILVVLAIFSAGAEESSASERGMQNREAADARRGLFYSIDEREYRLEIAASQGNQLTLSDGTIWSVSEKFVSPLVEGEEVVLRLYPSSYSGGESGHIYLINKEKRVAPAKYLGVATDQYKSIAAFENDKNVVVLSDGSIWSIPPISVDFFLNNRSSVDGWSVGDRVLVSNNVGIFYDDYLLIDLDLLGLEESSAAATAFKGS